MNEERAICRRCRLPLSAEDGPPGTLVCRFCRHLTARAWELAETREQRPDDSPPDPWAEMWLPAPPQMLSISETPAIMEQRAEEPPRKPRPEMRLPSGEARPRPSEVRPTPPPPARIVDRHWRTLYPSQAHGLAATLRCLQSTVWGDVVEVNIYEHSVGLVLA